MGICPNVVLEAERTNRRLAESDPDAWCLHTFQSRVTESLALISDMVGVDSANMCFTQTSGFAINQVLHSCGIKSSDAILRIDIAENESLLHFSSCSVRLFCSFPPPALPRHGVLTGEQRTFVLQ